MLDPYSFVAHFIGTFGPRKAGTAAEANAQVYLGEQLKGFCDSAEVEPFSAPLRAKFTSLKFFTIAFLVALALPLWSVPWAFALGLLNAVLFFFHFVLFHAVLDRFFPNVISHNSIGTIEPRGKVESTLIFSGHIDSTPEFIWWYWLKGLGAKAMIVAGASWLLYPVYLGVAWAFSSSVFGSVGWWVFVALAPLSATFFFIHGKRVVEGAQDNLSGVAVAYDVVRQLAEQRLERTRIRFIAFGAEECGLKGSAAYVRRYKAKLLQEKAQVINLDGILDIEHMYVVQRELMAMQTHDPALNTSLLEAFQRMGLPPKKGTIPIGGTDATSFSAQGIPATSIVGLPLGKLHPTYHTRLDTLEHLDPKTLSRMSAVLVDFAKAWDRRTAVVP